MDDIGLRLAAAVRDARQAQGLSVNAVAQRAEVSRAMIAKVEAGTAAPTATLLGRLSGALGLTLSELVARAEGHDRRLARRADQPTWTDPITGYLRRAVSPTSGGDLELVEVWLPAGAEASFAADTYAFLHHQIWVLDGRLDFAEGDVTHHLDTGDCLRLGDPLPCTYRNPSDQTCRYLVAVTRRSGPRRAAPSAGRTGRPR